MPLASPFRSPDQHIDGIGDLATERFGSTNKWFFVSAVITSVAVAALFAATSGTYGWWPFILLGVPSAVGSAVHIRKSPLGQHSYAVGHLVWLVLIGVCASYAGGAHSYLLPLLCTFTLGFFTRLAPVAAFSYAWLAFGLACVPVLVTDWSGFVASPWLLAACAAGLLSVTLMAAQMAAGEIQQRGEATIDQLTGLLNRRGLDHRLLELAQQGAVLGDDTPLAVVACDIDHFKLVNDMYGHARGDDVLRDVAYIIRKGLRRFELAYRMGGEEFLVVLPGHDAAAAAAVAETIRAAVQDGRPGGVEVTISMGVAAGRAADSVGEELLATADAALYTAKRTGRNRVSLGDTTEITAVGPAVGALPRA